MQLGIDVGGTYLRYMLKDKKTVLKEEKLLSKSIGLYAFLKMFLHTHVKVKTVFIAYAGQIQAGKIISAPHIEIDEPNIKERIEKEFAVKLFIDNDLNCAVLAEAQLYNTQDISAVYVGTGLGLGVISSGRVIRGFQNIATELGHIPYKKSPFECSCGKKNCIELFASGSALARWKQYYQLDTKLSLQALSNATDIKSKKIYHNFVEALLFAIGTTITLFNPQTLVLGGGIIIDDVALQTVILARVKEFALPLALKNIQIKISQKKDAALEGAFLLKDYND